jgi:hypothetical protein
VELDKYEARAVHAESRFMALKDELSDQADCNSRLLQGMCLLEHAYRREHHVESTNPPILDGFSLPRTTVPPFRMSESVLSAPPPTPCGEGTDNQDMFIDCTILEDGDPSLEPAYNPVLGRIRILTESRLTPMMVLHDYVSKRITPLQEHTRPAWLYTGVNDVT